MTPQEQMFIKTIDEYAAYITDWTYRKEFWVPGEDRNDGEMIALMHSELSEALDGLRHGNPPDDKIPNFSAVEAEMADTVIRILGTCHARHWRLGEAIVAKMVYNETCPTKNGKKF